MAVTGAEASVYMTLRLPVDLRQALMKEAEDRKIPMNEVMKQALEAYLKYKQRP